MIDKLKTIGAVLICLIFVSALILVIWMATPPFPLHMDTSSSSREGKLTCPKHIPLTGSKGKGIWITKIRLMDIDIKFYDPASKHWQVVLRNGCVVKFQRRKKSDDD